MTPPLARVDAHGKVTGTVHYGADRVPPGLAHAALAVATIGRGRIARIDTAAAQAVPDVRLVLTHLGPGELTTAGYLMAGGYALQSLQPLLGDHVAYRGQPIAIVVADTLPAAAEAAALVRAEYEAEPVSAELDSDGADTLEQAAAIPLPMFADVNVGDADGVFADCPVQVDAIFNCPPQHPAPMELIGCVAEWDGDTLTVHEGTQNADAVRHGLAAQLGIDAAQVRVISPYVGGAFGNKNSLQPHTSLAAVAARRLGRPVKLVLPRAQMFHGASFRPASRHRIRIGATRGGQLRAAIHEADQQTSRHDLFPASYTAMTSRLYGISDFRGRQRLVRTDVQTPGFMRAPYEHPAAFAFECAIDEVAYAAGQDPVDLRLSNDTAADPVTGQPFSSRHLADCLRRGADRFGWAKRTAEPGSMTAADGTLIGWGVAAGAYPASAAPAIARLRADTRGTLSIHVGGHEMGQGIRTAITQTITGELGVPAGSITVDVGDTRVVPQHVTAGSWGTATALPAVHAALLELRRQLTLPEAGPVDLRAALSAVGRDDIEVEAATRAPGQPAEIIDYLRGGGFAPAGPEYPGFTAFSFVAHFIEVRVEPTTRRIRVHRVVSIADCGRVASPVTAASQIRGAVVWGIGASLRERSEVDPRYGGFLNADLAEYVVPVNADVPDIDVGFIGIPDPQLNALGVKGLGEVAVVGVAPAIVNAVFHATGRRHRSLPIRLEDNL